MQPKRSLGLWTLTALVAGNMIGSGVYLLPSILATFGSISVLAWIFTGLGALLLALVFAKLSHAMPKVGGHYAFCREAFGDFVGFLVAYSYWIGVWVGNAAIVMVFVGYLSIFFPILAVSKWAAFWLALTTVWGLTFINVLGVKQAGILQLIATILKLLPLILIGSLGLFYIDPAHLAQFNVSEKSNFVAFSSAAAITMWAYIGLESATIPADDVKDPRRTIPRATILGCIITAVVYIFSTTAVLGIVGPQNLVNSAAPFADAAEIVFGSWGRILIGLGAAIACFGALNGWVLLQGQMPLAAAKDDLFPRAFAKLSNRGTPTFGLVVSSIFISLLLLLKLDASLADKFLFISLLATLAALIPYLLTCMAELIIFIRQRELFNSKRFTGSAIIALLAFLYSFWAIAGAGQEVVYYGILLLFSGIPVYVWVLWRRSSH